MLRSVVVVGLRGGTIVAAPTRMMMMIQSWKRDGLKPTSSYVVLNVTRLAPCFFIWIEYDSLECIYIYIYIKCSTGRSAYIYIYIYIYQIYNCKMNFEFCIPCLLFVVCCLLLLILRPSVHPSI